MINPYEGVNWQNVQHIQSCSHMHCTNDTQLSRICDDGFQHLGISNYYPSKPWYPLSGCFDSIPDDVIGSPNAEHHSAFVDGICYHNFHFNGLGSTWQSGKAQGEEPIGVQDTWQNAFRNILNSLLYKDGGGITLNHPTWTQLSFKDAIRFLDYDHRVLGIEIFNGPNDDTAWALDLWDEILKTGRRAWGFCVTDHFRDNIRPMEGQNILLVNKFTEKECLKAYREGRFYGKINATDLRFDKIECVNNTLNVNVNKDVEIKIVSNVETKTFENVKSVEGYTIPSDAVYVRVEAHCEKDDKKGYKEDFVFSNPFILKPFEKRRGINKLMWF